MNPNPTRTWLLIGVGLILVAGFVFYNFFYQKSISNKKQASPGPVGSPTTTPSSQVSVISDPGVSWIEPELLGDLGLIKIGAEDTGISAVRYYKIADLDSGGELILASLEFDGPSLPVLYRFKKDADGSYSYLANHSSERDYGVVSKVLASGVNFDQTTTYQSLSAPDFLKVDDTTLRAANNVGLFSSLQHPPEELGQTEYGRIFQTINTSADNDETGGSALNLKLADSTYKVYTIKAPFMTDDEVAQVTWSDKTKNSSKYTSEGYIGCAMSASDNVIINTTDIDSRLKEAGQTNSGDQVYTVSEDDPVMRAAYENYKTGRTEVLSIKDFVAKKPVFIWKSGLDIYIIFTGRDFAGLAECGKPVIYLYPEKPTKVSVKVGVTISKSEPEYNGGWEVLAEPSGKLHLGQTVYDYLYWEGLGQEYPLLNEGTVVKKEDVPATLKKQLEELGLNSQEKADFLEFWLKKMPDKPYIRLTWFGTNLLNKLAPLSVSPTPDTLIRVFLDFEGLDKLTNIPSQKLSAPQRKGFTVVEWGGLLRE